MYWLGIDIGTGGSRALLVNEKGAVVSGFTAPNEDMKMDRRSGPNSGPRTGGTPRKPPSRAC